MSYRRFREQWLSRSDDGQKLDAILRNQWIIKDALKMLTGVEIMNLAKFTRLIADVTANKDAVAANTAAWTAAIQSIRDAQGNEELPPEVEAAITQIEANTAALAAAPIAGTAGAPPIEVPPVVDTGASLAGAESN